MPIRGTIEKYAEPYGLNLGAACKKGKIHQLKIAHRAEILKHNPEASLKLAGQQAKKDVDKVLPLKQKSAWNIAVAKASRDLNLPKDGTKATAQANFKKVLARAQETYVAKPKKAKK